MDQYPDLGFESYDRLFPNQDTMPKGGFGNLIALPLQKKAREHGNSKFVDEHFVAYPDQWAYLSTIKRISPFELRFRLDKAWQQNHAKTEVRIYDYVDDQVPMLSKMSERRKVGYRSLGYKMIDS